MKIIRASIDDTDIFSENELNFGACCFFTEDKLCKYFFEIEGRVATLFSNSQQYTFQAINEFLFYSGFITTIRDENGAVLLNRKPNKAYLYEISKLQVSQFYISEVKLESCKKWIRCQDDIFVPIVVSDGKTILIDGHTRVRAANDLGYSSVNVYLDEFDDYIFHFVSEAIKRKINNVSDMELICHEEYKLKWYKFCDDFFKRQK